MQSIRDEETPTCCCKEASADEVRLTQILISFIRVGSGMFGGGYAMLPLLEREIVDQRQWATHEDMADLFALAQVIPGVIAVNTAMLVGQRLRGWRGTIVAAVGTVTVPFLIILLLAFSFEAMIRNPLVARFIAGLRPAVVGLLLGTAFRLILRGWRTRWAWALGLFVSVLTLFYALNPVLPILGGIVTGLLTQAFISHRQSRETC